MGIQTIKQNLVYVGIAALIFAILSWIRPVHPFQPTGIILPMTKQTLIPTMKNIQLFQAMPVSATQLAYINIEGHSLKPTRVQENQMLVTANSMAQQVGANGLVINTFGYEGASSDDPAPLAKYVLFATAIRLDK